MNVATPFAWQITLLVALAGGVAILWLWKRNRGLAPRTILRTLTTLRSMLLVMLVAVLLNPYCTQRTPDPEAYTVAVLADASASMLATDLDGASRLDFVADEMRADSTDNLRARLAGQHPLEVYAFAGNVSAPIDHIELQSGRAAIGKALEHLHERHTARGMELGAVLLLSDGVTEGTPSPIRAAQRYREHGIPIHVLGVGDPTETGDVSIRFVQREHRGTRDEGLPLELELQNTFAEERALELELAEDGETIERREVTLAAGETRRTGFEVTPRRGGFRSYRARIASSRYLGSPGSNTDYASALIEESAFHRVLYLGTPQWEYRFLRILIEEEEQFQMQAWLRTAPERIVRRGFNDDEDTAAQDDFPDDPSTLQDYDTIIVDARIMGDLDTATHNALRDFVSIGGGGLLLWGPTPEDDSAFAPLLPVRGGTAVSERQRRSLNPVPGPLLREEDHEVYTRGPALFLAEDATAYLPERLSRGARSALETRDENPLFTYQAYGAGRVAYQGSEHFWRWRMESSTGTEQHRRFWLSALAWLSESRKPRLETPIQGRVQALDEPAQLGVRLLDSAFRPRADARVRARITEPDGTVRQRLLFPKFGDPGTFEAELDLIRPGEYRVEYEAAFPDGETLRAEAFFNTTATGELIDTSMREQLLRDIARLSGGTYYPWTEASRLREVAISQEVPIVEANIHWARSFPFAALLAGMAIAEWFLRRRFGLR